MRTTLVLLAMLTAYSVGAIAEAVAQATPTQPVEKLVKDIPLQAYFHTRHAWRLKIYEENDGLSIASTGEPLPVRVCFVFPPSPNESPPPCWSGAFQRLDSVQLRLVPSPNGTVDRPLVVIRLTGQIGPTIHGTTHGLVAWEHDPIIGFYTAIKSTVSFSGDQKLVTTGPLAGAFIKVDEFREGNEPTAASPQHYRMRVYERVRLGYLKVLSVLSKNRYPSPLLDAIPHPIATLTPEIVSDMSAVYPRGVYARAVQR